MRIVPRELSKSFRIIRQEASAQTSRLAILLGLNPYGKEKAQENLRSGVDDAMALLPVTRSRMDNLGDQRRTGLLTPQLIQRYSLLRAWEAERLAARSRIPADGIKAG